MKTKNILIAAALCASFLLTGGNAAPANEIALQSCKAAYLCDAQTGTEVYAKDAEKRLPIASMCKIMTLLLTFESAERGELCYDELITVSENASGMGGSQVFLDTGLSYRADKLIKTVAVCSANDSCVALAERIAGSETAFVARMNERAKELGAQNTLFANCTGLPKEPQYSCAKDVSLMLRALVKHPKYFELSHVRVEDFSHPDGRTTQITNTNRLLRSYRGCDGGKTGFTNEAGFCLAATAKRGETRLVSVLIGGESSDARFRGVSDMFDYAFDRYETKIVLAAGKPIGKAKVSGSREGETEYSAREDLTVFTKRGEAENYQVEYEFNELRAPVSKGSEIGRARLYRDGVEIGETALLSEADVHRMSWWDALRETARNWQ